MMNVLSGISKSITSYFKSTLTLSHRPHSNYEREQISAIFATMSIQIVFSLSKM